MKLFLIFFAVVLFAFNSFAQTVEAPAAPTGKVKITFSDELNEKLLDNMRYRYAQKDIQTLTFRKKELERQLRSQKLSDQTRQRLDLEYLVIQERLAQTEQP